MGANPRTIGSKNDFADGFVCLKKEAQYLHQSGAVETFPSHGLFQDKLKI